VPFVFSMGALTSRQHAGVEEVDIVSNHAYKYPPRSGIQEFKFGSNFVSIGINGNLYTFLSI